MSEQPGASRDGAGDRRDPTRVLNQAALQTSSGRIWIVMGGLFALISLVPLSLLIFAGNGWSRGVAIPVAVTVIVLFAAIVLARFVLRPGPLRLRVMAACMLAMAAVALGGVLACAIIESAGWTGTG
ncbi:MAG: hypothetical protein J0H64_04410 [Actinobacteria bacterium]|nr:hypothetical protein [Actinomycetota bacterium]